ncbi:putative AC transposase [Fusarium oxysporum f. sp. albedinis]|nr:putative AC transposase [Fusarium oxysporum f. sp. albedinis]
MVEELKSQPRNIRTRLVKIGSPRCRSFSGDWKWKLSGKLCCLNHLKITLSAHHYLTSGWKSLLMTLLYQLPPVSGPDTRFDGPCPLVLGPDTRNHGPCTPRTPVTADQMV